MSHVDDLEVLLEEKYGSTSQERIYLKRSANNAIVIVDEQKFTNVKSWLTKIFLPQGYPDSVSGDYTTYQVWDTAQACCSTITGTLATQEILRSVGVGDMTVTPLSATITWVSKEACGHIGRILFAYTHGTFLDAYSKKWRLYADTLNDAAMCIEMALPLFKNYTTFALCVTTGMKAVVGVAGAATRAALTQHHAIRGNMADVLAKDSAQETAVNLIGTVLSLLILYTFGNSLLIFFVTIILHIIFNYLAVRSVCLKTLNEPRFLVIISQYLREELIKTPCEINRREPIICHPFGQYLLDFQYCGFQIKSGHSIKEVIKDKAEYLENVIEIYNMNYYMLIPNIKTRKMYIIVKCNASSDDILCAYFHAVLFSIIICAINNDQSPCCIEESRPFGKICRILQSCQWTRYLEHSSQTSSKGFIYNPSYALIKYVNKTVQKEWHKLKNALISVGWDLSKHLLIVDEWRFSDRKTANNGDTNTNKEVPVKVNFQESILNRNICITSFENAYSYVKDID